MLNKHKILNDLKLNLNPVTVVASKKVISYLDNVINAAMNLYLEAKVNNVAIYLCHNLFSQQYCNRNSI